MRGYLRDASITTVLTLTVAVGGEFPNHAAMGV
jgi:hypothetical protein